MEADLSHKIFVLRREYLFQGLDTPQLARVAGFFETIEYAKDQIIFSEGSKPDFFYVVLEGKVSISQLQKKKDRQLNILGPGDFFGEAALLFDTERTATAKAYTRVTLIRLSRDRFQMLLKEYPQMRTNLTATAQGRGLARKAAFSWLGDEEIIYFITRKHKFFLYVMLFGPAALFVLGAVILAFLLNRGPVTGLLTVGVAAPFLISVIWGVWIWVDWSNDYYVVTNQRVVFQEKIVLLYDSRQEAPLNTVVAVNTTTSWLGRIFHYGNVEVRTFTGIIPMRRMSQPYQFASFVEGYKKRILSISKESEVRDMEQALETALRKSLAAPAEDVVAVKPPTPPAAKLAPKKSPLVDAWHAFWKTFLKVRYQEGQVITYRKHWLLLVRGAGAAFTVTVVILALTLWALFAGQWLLFGIGFLLFIGAIVWLTYEYLDWSNDIYRLTPEQILDIEKKPLGQEQKKTANLDAPDFRVEHIRASIINIFFNFGDVVVNVGQTKFTFNGVYNPDQVHQDVANYREALTRRKREDEAKRERDRMINWLVVFHRQTEKIETQEVVVHLAPGVSMELICVPAGAFTMGLTFEQAQKLIAAGLSTELADAAKPQHLVNLAEYWVAKHPVTNLQYQAFLQAQTSDSGRERKRRPPNYWIGGVIPRNMEQHPVVQVSWEDANAFCHWASQVTGYDLRLPTEAEWEKAARGTDARLYPWGNQPPDVKLCAYTPALSSTAPVGKYSPQGNSPYGCVDMAGNVWEWCSDWFNPNEFKNRLKEGTANPQGPVEGQLRSVRGGSWQMEIGYVHAASRQGKEPALKHQDVGFRVVRFS